MTARLRTIVLLSLIAVLGAGVGIGWALSPTGELRINARPLADGRIEFGIEHDGQRLLPTQRFLTPERAASHRGQWLRSSPVSIPAQSGSELESESSGSSARSPVYPTDRFGYDDDDRPEYHRDADGNCWEYEYGRWTRDDDCGDDDDRSEYRRDADGNCWEYEYGRWVRDDDCGDDDDRSEYRRDADGNCWEYEYGRWVRDDCD